MIEMLGWLISLVTLGLSIIFYIKMKKKYIVAYLISIGLYVFTIIFFIDAFNLTKELILLLLLISALLMIYIGRKI